MPDKENKYVDPVQAMLEEKKTPTDSTGDLAKNDANTEKNSSPPVNENDTTPQETTNSDNVDDLQTPKPIYGGDVENNTDDTPVADTSPQDNAASESSEAVLVKNESEELVAINTGTDVKASGSTDLITRHGAEDDEDVTRIPIGQALINKGLISKDQLQIALKIQRESQGSTMIGTILVDMGFITESALGEVLTANTNIKQFDPKTNIIDPNLIKQIPKDVAQRFNAVPILLEGDSVYIAITDVYNVLAVDRIQRYFPKRFKMVPIHCSPADLSEIIDNYYDYELSIDGILREIEALQNESLESFDVEDDTYTNPTVRLVDALMVDAIREGASDIHFEPEDSFVRLRYRVDGKLKQIRSFHRDYWMSIVVRIKIMAEINITETRNPQDGRITINALGRQIDFRVATQPTIHGENIVMRILDKTKALLPMPKLGFTAENVEKLKIALQSPEGIIVVTGPTGSGKTTTLYSLLSHINSPDINIMTLEDPVEYRLPLIRQANIKSGTGMDFVGGIKSTMRQDPDVIFVGEVRDEETATMALRAAMTGHQVFTSLHTNDAIGAIPRFVDIGVNPKMLSGSIIACVAQRLARRLCKECKEKGPATKDEIKIMGLDKKNTPELYHKKGCDECDHTGYKGRVAISEIISFDEELNELIANEASRAEMLRYLHKNDFKGMAEDGILKVIDGMLDLEELIHTINMTDRF